MKTSKWSQAAHHFLPNLVGIPRFVLARPGFAFKLLKARVKYFFTRQLAGPIATPDGFLIESTSELVSYWSFFVEREGLDPDWANALRSATKPLVVDVGANAGLFAHLVLTVQPDTRFILFEPLPSMVKKITQWGTTTHASYTLHDKAASNYCGTTAFYASQENDVAASIRPEPHKHLKFEVGVVTLDSVLPDEPILILKIDVEGAECEVLAGAKRTLDRSRFVILEAHTLDDLGRLKQALGEQWVAKQVGAIDYLFTKRQPSPKD